jgi:hypothetical protein
MAMILYERSAEPSDRVKILLRSDYGLLTTAASTLQVSVDSEPIITLSYNHFFIFCIRKWNEYREVDRRRGRTQANQLPPDASSQVSGSERWDNVRDAYLDYTMVLCKKCSGKIEGTLILSNADNEILSEMSEQTWDYNQNRFQV